MYIGETGRPVKQRFYEHNRDAINNDKTKPCGKHFNKTGDSITDMIVIAIEQVLPKEDPLLRKKRESFWINQYLAVDHGAISDPNLLNAITNFLDISNFLNLPLKPPP